MKHPKTYKIKNLFFKFVEGTEFEGQLNAADVADCFRRLGWIELSPGLDRYSETATLHKQTEQKILNALEQYVIDQK